MDDIGGGRGHTKAATAKSMGCGSELFHTSAWVPLHTVETALKRVVCFWTGDDPCRSRYARTGRTHWSVRVQSPRIDQPIQEHLVPI